MRIEEEIEKVIAIYKLKYIATTSACPIAIQNKSEQFIIALFVLLSVRICVQKQQQKK